MSKKLAIDDITTPEKMYVLRAVSAGDAFFLGNREWESQTTSWFWTKNPGVAYTHYNKLKMGILKESLKPFSNPGDDVDLFPRNPLFMKLLKLSKVVGVESINEEYLDPSEVPTAEEIYKESMPDYEKITEAHKVSPQKIEAAKPTFEKIIEELAIREITMRVIWGANNRLGYEVVGFYKSDYITLTQLENGAFLSTDRYGEKTTIASMEDIADLNYEWWMRSKDRHQGWAEPSRPWKRIHEEFDCKERA